MLGSTVLVALAMKSSCSLLGIALALQAPVAMVQDQGEQGGLETIVVTARKKVENLQNIPVAETVLSAEKIENLGISSVEKISNIAPQLIIGRSGPGSGSAFGLRGISVNTTSISLEQSVATVIDGVYYSGGRALNEGLFDVAQVEVLKGPQSLFYGKNTTAGAISITTALPTFDFQGMARASYEFKGDMPTLEGYVSAPLGETVAVRVAGRWSRQYGAYFKNVTSPQDIVVTDVATGNTTLQTIPTGISDQPGAEAAIARGSVLFEPSDAFRAVIRASYNANDIDAINANQVRTHCPTGVAQTDPIAPCRRRRVITEQGVSPEYAASNPLLGLRGGLPYGQYRSFAMNGSLDYTGKKVTVSLVQGYVWWRNRFLGDFDHSINFPTPATDGNHGSEESGIKAFSSELRVQTKFDGSINFMAGGYFQDSTLSFLQDIIFPGGLRNSAASDPELEYLTIRKVSSTKGKTYAGFGQILFDISDQLNFTAGARYTREDKVSVFSQPYVVPGYDVIYPEGTIGADQAFNNFSPEATVTFKPTPDVTTYVSYKTGYKSGGFSVSGLIVVGQDPSEPAFEPEKVKGWEAGVKTTLTDNQLRLNLDLFNYTYSNLQVDFFNSATISYLTLNAGKARTRGGELQFEFAPRGTPGLSVTGALGYTDAKYASFPFAPCMAGQTPANGCTIGMTPEGVRAYQDLTGQPTQQAPEWTGSLGIDYEQDLGSALKFGLSGNMRYSSSYNLNPFVFDGADAFTQGSFATFDVSARLGAADDRWELALIGRNLTNEFIASSAEDVPYTGSNTGLPSGIAADTLGSINDPRTIALQATVRF